VLLAGLMSAVHAHLAFTPPVHTSYSQVAFGHVILAGLMSAVHSHLPFTPPVHTSRSRVHRRCMAYKGDTSTHAQGTDPKVGLGA